MHSRLSDRRKVQLLILSFSLVLLLGLALLARRLALPPHRSASLSETPVPLADVPMSDEFGKTVELSDFRGSWVIVYFGYTHCPDTCPTTLTDLARAVRGLGKEASRVQVLFVTLDPARDSLKSLASYLPFFDPSFLGIRATGARLAALTREFYVSYRKVGKGKDYTLAHSTYCSLVDPSGRLKTVFETPVSPSTLRGFLHS